MPTITLTKKEIQERVGKKLTDTQLQEELPMLGINIEHFEKEEIELEITPNHPEMLSVEGVARALRGFLGIETGLKNYPIKKGKMRVNVHNNVKNVRPYTACAIVRNLNLDDAKLKSIIQLQEKLHTTFCRNRKKSAIGVYPLENISEPIEFMAKKPEEILFVPLDSSEVMDGREILEKHPKGKEYAHLLKDLKEYPVFVDAMNNILSMPPIINGAFAGKVTTKTRAVFIETSGYNIEQQKQGLNILVTTLAEMGGQIESVDVYYGNKKITLPDLEPTTIKVKHEYINKLLGLKLKTQEREKLLKKMGFNVKGETVYVPAWRVDILHPIDIVEECAIAYRYTQFRPEIPTVATIAEENESEKNKSRYAETVVGAGFQEVMTSHLSSKEIQQQAMQSQESVTEVENAISAEHNVLRNAILPQLLSVYKQNKHREYPQRIFEIGNCFKGMKEEEHLAIATAHTTANFTEIKQVFEACFKQWGISVEWKEEDHPSFIPGRCGSLWKNEKKLGFCGEIHPRVLRSFEIEMPVAGAELVTAELKDY